MICYRQKGWEQIFGIWQLIIAYQLLNFNFLLIQEGIKEKAKSGSSSYLSDNFTAIKLRNTTYICSENSNRIETCTVKNAILLLPSFLKILASVGFICVIFFQEKHALNVIYVFISLYAMPYLCWGHTATYSELHFVDFIMYIVGVFPCQAIQSYWFLLNSCVVFHDVLGRKCL